VDSRLGQHLLGVPLLGVRHMCPDCGNPPDAFCPVCLGAGDISTERLDRWQAAQNVALAQRSDTDT